MPATTRTTEDSEANANADAHSLDDFDLALDAPPSSVTARQRQRQFSVVSARSARTTRSIQSNLTNAEAHEWRRSISDIQRQSTVDQGLDGDDFSPKTPAAPFVGYASAENSPSQVPGPSLPNVNDPTANSASQHYSAVSPPFTTISMPAHPHGDGKFLGETIRESDEEGDEGEDDDQYLPSFSAPGPAITRSSEQESPRSSFPNTLRASMSIPVGRPTYTSANSSGPLLGDSSAVNTPLSAISDPFNDRKRSEHDTRGDSLETTPDLHPGSTAARSALVPPTINLIPNSPATQGSATLTPGLGVPSAAPLSTYGTSFSSGHGSAHTFGANTLSAVDRRASLAPSAATQHSGVSGLSGYTSAMDRSKPSTIAERRSQRMKQVMSKKSGKKERDSKLVGAQTSRKPFQSTRLKEEIYKPWLEKKDPAQRWARWITLFSIFLGVAVMGVICYDGYASVPKLGNTCSVLMEDFSNGLNPEVWTRENRVDGFGHGSFDWTSASPNNSFVDDKTLYIVPTLTSDLIGEGAIQNGFTLNLTADGTCTSTNTSQCVAVSNSSQLTVINPVMSARLTTRLSANIRYGKIEVVARFPTGDWLWPSISLYPVNETYGRNVRSGQVDIVTGRGNNASYTQRGVDYAQSDLHWGPTTDLDRMYMTWGYREQRRSSYNQGFRTFGFEWNENYLWTYIDSRVAQVISLKFDQSFWNRGKFPSTITNTTTGDVVRLTNPWITSNNNNAPFDQPFYLSLSLAVGATDGWFPDGEGGKPWLDNSLSAMSDFWNAKNKWWSNWPSDPKVRGFAIKSVKMWKTC